MNKIELLAPAGSLEKVKWAIDYGADAVFLGGEHFSLRANASNLKDPEIKKAVTYAHKRGKLVYVTINIIFHETDFKELKQYLLKLQTYKVDALIVSDIGVISKIKAIIPDMKIHLSTQASVYNYEAALFYEKLGVKRIVLARECSKADIKKIISQTNLEVEVFIHGAMCSGFSGRCILSNELTKRDANRGGCSQVCRFKFDLTKNNELVGADLPFSLNTKDLSMAPYIKELIELGVTSLKIEGRMRSIYYIATTCHIYKLIINDYMHQLKDYTYNEKYASLLNQCSNRHSTPQFYNSDKAVHASYYDLKNIPSNQDFLAIVLDYNEATKVATIEQRNNFKVGTKVCAFGPNTPLTSFVIDNLVSVEGVLVDTARHPKEKLMFKTNHKLAKSDIIRIDYS